MDGRGGVRQQTRCSAGHRVEENLGVVPCTVMSMMSNELLSSACEVDICGVLGMHALQLASGTPSALLSWMMIRI